MCGKPATTNLVLAMCFWPGSRAPIAPGDGVPGVVCNSLPDLTVFKTHPHIEFTGLYRSSIRGGGCGCALGLFALRYRRPKQAQHPHHLPREGGLYRRHLRTVLLSPPQERDRHRSPATPSSPDCTLRHKPSPRRDHPLGPRNHQCQARQAPQEPHRLCALGRDGHPRAAVQQPPQTRADASLLRALGRPVGPRLVLPDDHRTQPRWYP